MKDTIYREDAIEAINKSFDKETLLKCFMRKIAIDAIIQVPSAHRPQGEWIKRHGTINCSVCKRSNWSACFEDTVRSFNFCPNCGAKMKGADDERR